MLHKRIVCLLLVLMLVLGVSGTALAAEVECDATYCFSAEDFASDEPLVGICITELPDAAAGTVMLGTRVIRPGDILTADQLAQMTFAPLLTETDASASVSYLPIYEDYVADSATMTISIRGREDKAPVAEDFAMETYKNLPNQGRLKASDPEGQALVYTVTRQPKRGEVVINEDGSFTYTPKKNKVGVDSFTFTAADPAGNVSREATVTIQILKPTDSRQYTDTIGKECRFAAEWMRNTGLFVGEKVGDSQCFGPEKTVSRGEFLTMVIKSLDIPVEEDNAYTGVSGDTPDWLKPYVAAAIRSGLTAGLPAGETADYSAPITGAEAAVMLQNALDLTVSGEMAAEVPAWAQDALTAMADNGIDLPAGESLTRAQVALTMYQVSVLAPNAPGTAVFRLQK